MHHINWKKTSEFVSIIDQIKNGEDDIVITIARHVHLWWFHVRIIWSLSSKKNIVFITNDERAKKLLKQSGYKVFISLHDMRQVFPDGFVLMRENITTFEYVRFHISRFFSKFSVIFRGISAKPYDVFFVKHSSWYMMVLGIFIVLLLIFGVVTLTSPHATIIITPQINIQNAIRNVEFVLEENLWEWPRVPLRKDTFPFQLQKTYPINTVNEELARKSYWTIQIQSRNPEKITLKAQTRITTGSLVYRIKKNLAIPASLDNSPVTVTASVFADSLWLDGIISGSRANIVKDTLLLIPGLPDENQSLLSVVALGDFVGGEDWYMPLLTQVEFDRLQKLFQDDFLNNAQNLINHSFESGSEYIPLPIPEALDLLDMTLTTDVSVWSAADKIVFTGKWNFLVYFYHVDSLRKILRSFAQEHILQGVESLIDTKDTLPDIISVLKKNDDPFSIKATAQIPVQILYDFGSSAGQKWLQNILSDLLWAETDRVIKTLLNHPYIKYIDIRLTPFWSQRIPHVLDKIYIKVADSSN